MLRETLLKSITYAFEKSRVMLSFIVKFKLVNVSLPFIFTILQLPLASSLILGLNYARSDSRVVI